MKIHRKKHTVEIDECDLPLYNSRAWEVVKNGRTKYLISCNKIDGHQRHFHRFVMNANAGQIVDHKDGNGLNNQRCNLRFCTPSQNKQNSKKKNGVYSSRFKGVHLREDGKRWRVRLTVDKRRVELGTTCFETVAARIYNHWAKHFFGEFAELNEV